MVKMKNGTPEASRKKRKGIHAKSGSSKLKTSRNYKKKYKGQGR